MTYDQYTDDSYNLPGDTEQYPTYDEYNEDASDLDDSSRYRDTLEL